MTRLRIAAVQYSLRPIESFARFREQVEGWIVRAVEKRCRLVVFPEYFTLQLLSLGDVRRPMVEQVRDLAGQAPSFVGMMELLARRHGVHVIAGTIPVAGGPEGPVTNRCHLFSPEGRAGVQGKLHVTPSEARWGISEDPGLKVFETDFGSIAVATCYDAEFPEVARAAARSGAILLAVPSCTEDRQGFTRVRACAQARAIENQMAVVHVSTVGALPAIPDVAHHYGRSSILTPSDAGFAPDGIVAEGAADEESLIVGEVDLEAIRESRRLGTVHPFADSGATAEKVAHVRVERL